MIRTSPAIYYRAAGAVLAAAVLSLSTHRAAAQQTVDLLGGTLGTTTTVTTTGGTTPSTTFGPGYSGVVTTAVSLNGSLAESFAQSGSSNTFAVTVGGGVSALGSTSATKTFTGVSLSPGATYNLTLGRTSAFTVGVLSGLTVTLTEGGTQLVTTTGNSGLLGAADLLTFFSSNNTATLQFTVPSNATGNLVASITSNTTGGAAGTDTLTSASVTQVPEPRTVVTMLLGAGGLAMLRFRNRLRMA